MEPDAYEDYLELYPDTEYLEDFELHDNCVIPSIKSVSGRIFDLIAYNLLFNIITSLISSGMYHVVSFAFGIMLLSEITDFLNLSIIMVFFLLSYGLLKLSYKIRRNNYISPVNVTAFFYIASLVYCEFRFPRPKVWLQVRGEVMIMTMKVYSLISDMIVSRRCPSFIEFAGYTLCPANCIFGPWLSFEDYKTLHKRNKKDIQWVIRTFICLITAVIFLLFSNCWISYYITSENEFITAFRMALTFRTSHYFISYLSELGMIVAGFRSKKSKNKSRYEIVKPMDIEFPTSLVSVVVGWNIPVHVFLKTYVYKKMLPFGRFQAIFSTFFVSSLLHGFNWEISVILLTLGLFCYVQLKTQERLSEHLNACVGVKPCNNDCTHRFKKKSWVVRIVTVILGLLTVVHLAYLGMLMDVLDNPESSSVYEKWHSLGFFSHIIMLISYLYSLI